MGFGKDVRACLHGGGGPQIGEVTRLTVVENKTRLHAILQPRGARVLLRLQLGSLSAGVLSSHLEKDERLILGHIGIYS